MRVFSVVVAVATLALGVGASSKPPRGFAYRNGDHFEIDGQPFVRPISVFSGDVVILI